MIRNVRNIRGYLYLLLVAGLVCSFVFIPNQSAWANDPNNKVVQEMTGRFTYDGGSLNPVSEVFTMPVVATPNGFTIQSFEIKLINRIYDMDNLIIRVESQGSSYEAHTNGRFDLYADDVILKCSYGDEYAWLYGYDIIVMPEFKVGVRPAGIHSSYIRMYAYGLTSASSRHMVNTYPSILIPPSNPVIVLDDIGQTSIEFTVTNAINYNAASLQRYSPETDKWVNIATNIGNNHKFKDEGLKPGTTYRYRTVSTAVNIYDPSKNITVYNYQGGKHYAEFITASDPAVVAAQKAENAAQLARIAAENSVQYSLDAKQAAQDTFGQVTNPGYGLSALRTEILNIKTSVDSNRQAPVINHLKGLNNATATKYSTIILDSAVSNATHYRINNGPWQEYTQSQLTFNNVTKGINRIEVDFGNLTEKDGAFEGSTSKGIITIFGL